MMRRHGAEEISQNVEDFDIIIATQGWQSRLYVVDTMYPSIGKRARPGTGGPGDVCSFSRLPSTKIAVKQQHRGLGGGG